MATVEITKHLWDFLPPLRGKVLSIDATSVAEVVREVVRIAPGFTDSSATSAVVAARRARGRRR